MIYGIDVWEGALDIDEAIILEAGVKYVIPRLNDINGGHHPDANFLMEWEQCSSFLRGPYFVYNPWVNASINVQFLMDTLSSYNILPQITKIMHDIEVRKDGYPTDEYARQIASYFQLLEHYRYSNLIYTGQWFLSNLSYWPTNFDYCWARYPWYVYPTNTTNISWADLMTRINQLGWNPDPVRKCPGVIKSWQCTADRYIMPGTANRPMDVMISNLDWESFKNWWGVQNVQPSLEQRLANLEAQARLHGWTV